MSIWIPENLESARKATDGKAIIRVYDVGVKVVTTGRFCRNTFGDKIYPNVEFVCNTIKHEIETRKKMLKGQDLPRW